MTVLALNQTLDDSISHVNEEGAPDLASYDRSCRLAGALRLLDGGSSTEAVHWYSRHQETTSSHDYWQLLSRGDSGRDGFTPSSRK